MEIGPRDALLTAGTTGALAVGAILILVGSAMLTTVGVALVTLSAIVLLADARDLLAKTDRNDGE